MSTSDRQPRRAAKGDMRIFLSYSAPQRRIADQIRHALAQRRPGLDIYFAPLRNEAGAYWIARLESELAKADAVVLLLGRRVGPWQELEYFEALRHHRQAGHPSIVPLLLVDSVPGLPFLEQFHRLNCADYPFDELVERILQALDGVHVAATVASWRLVNPYRGLLAMETQDAAFFFGREALTAEILDRLARHQDRIVTLVGNSGVGKSSIAMAGVLSSLRSRLWPGRHEAPWPDALERSQTWPIVMFRPGETPVKALAQACVGLWLDSPADIEAEALKWRQLLMGDSSLGALITALLGQVAERAGAEAPERVVVYVDQGEELYSRADAREARRFSELMAQAVRGPQLLAMLSLRSDYYGRFQDDADLFQAAQTVDITPMDRDAIERVIRQPAQRLGVRFEPPEIAAHIAEAAAREPGSMPMLSDLLADAWRDMAEDRQSEAVLRFPADIVDISRPLADKAERFLTRHREDEDILRRLFTLKLALVPKEGDIVRRRARRAECSEAEWGLIEAMAERDWRLLTTGAEGGEPVAEVAHEALLRHWPRAARWLDESREFLIWKGQFETEYRAWEDAAESDRERALLTGLRLEAAVRWRQERGDDLTAAQRAFIAASEQAVAEALAREREAARRLERQRAWIQRLSVSALVVVAIVAAAALWQGHKAREAEQVAISEERKATEARNEAQRQARLSDARRLAVAAESVLDGNAGELSLAGLLATASLKQSPTLEGKRVSRRVLSLMPRSQGLETPWPSSNLHYSPDGRLIAYSRVSGTGEGPASGQVAVIDLRSWQRRGLHDFEGRSWPRLSTDGRWLAVAGYGRRLQVLDNLSGNVALDVRQDDMVDVAFHPEGRTLYVARTDGVIEVREAPAWQVARTLAYPLEGSRHRQVAIHVSPSGKRLLIYAQTGRDGSHNPWLIPTAGGEPWALGTKGAHLGRFTASGDFVVTASRDDEIGIWDARTGTRTRNFSVGADVAALVITPDGESVVIATRSGAVSAHDLATGVVQGEYHHEAWVNAVALSSDGELLATASDDGTAVLWERRTGRKRLTVDHQDEVWVVAFGVNQTLLTGGKDGSLRATDIATGQELHRLRFDGGVRGLVHDAATGLLALDVRGTHYDQSWTDLVVVDRRSGEEVSRLEHNGAFSRLAFSPDGSAIATATVRTGSLKVWDTGTGVLRIDPGISAASLSFSHDGRRLLAGGGSREVGVIDVTEGRHMATLGEPGGVEVVQILPNGQTAITYGQDDTFRAWELKSGALLWKRTADRPNTNDIVLSGDGRRFADRSRNGRAIEIAETRTGRPIASIPVGERSSYVLSHDGGHLLLTRIGLSDPAHPARPYSTVELWSVDESERVFARRLAYGWVTVTPLMGDTAMLSASQLRKGEDAGFVEVFDIKTGQVTWSAEVGFGPIKALPDSRGSLTLGIATPTATQVRDVKAGKLLFEAAGMRVSRFVALPEKSLILWTDGAVIEIRDVRNGELLRRIDDFKAIRHIRIDADGRRLFAAIDDDTRNGIAIWRTADWSLVRFIAMDSPVRSMHPLPDTDLVAAYDHADTLRTWRIATGQEVKRFAHTKTATGFAVAAGADRTVTWRGSSLRIWNTPDGTELAHRISHGGVTSLALSPDGRVVAYVTDRPRTSKRGDPYKALVIWEPETEAEPVILPLATARDLQFDPRGNFLAARVGDETVQLFDVATLRTIATLNALPAAKVNKIAFSGDGTLLYVQETKDRKYGLRVFRAGSETEVARIDQSPQFVPLPETPHAATRDENGRWRFWEVTSAMPDALLWSIKADELTYNHRSGRFVARRALSPADSVPEILRDAVILAPQSDGPRFHTWAIDLNQRRLAGMREGDALVVDLDNGRALARWSNLELKGAGVGVGHHFRAVRGMVFADGGDTLLAYDTDSYGTADMRSRLWLWRWQAETPQLISERNPINMIAVSPAGDLFASAEGNDYRDGRSGSRGRVGEAQVRIWRAQAGQELGRIPMEEYVDAVAFSLAADRLVARTSRAVVVFDVRDQKEIARFQFTGRRSAAGSVAFAPDGRHVTAEVADGIQMWSVDGMTHRFFRHGSDWPRYQLSRDGQLLVTLSTTALRVWEVASGAALFHLSFPNRYYKNVLLHGPTDDLVAETAAGLVRIPWKADHLIAESCARIVRDIGDDEWRRFFDQAPAAEICPADGGGIQAQPRR